MTIECRGGDPAGLYLAILLKERDPARTVRIRASADVASSNLPNITETPIRPSFALRDAELNAEIARLTTRCTGIEIVTKSRTVRSEQPYALLATDALVQALEARARRAGCERVSGAASDDPSISLIIAADGPESATRAQHEAFGTQFSPSTLRHVVISVDVPVPALRCMFAETDFGILHAYHFPCIGDRSTLVVEAPQSVLETFRLPSQDAQAILNLCRTLFQDQVGGREWTLSSPGWRPFVSVRNKAWRAGHTIVIGGAAHTSHVSVGLALRDSLESAEAFADAIASRADWQKSFDTVAAARHAKAESLYRASAASVSWFEHVRRYWKMPGAQFAYSCLTRTLRLHHENMRAFAPALVREVEDILAGNARVGNAAPPPMFLPFKLRGVSLPNRIAMSPMCMYSAKDGVVNDFHLVHLGSRAMGGAGLVITEMTDVSPEGRISLHCAGMYAPEHVTAWKRIVDFVHARSQAKIAIQLGHAGRKGSLTRSWEGHQPLEHGWDILAPSAIPFAPDRAVPKAMNRADLDRVRDAYVAAARMSDDAGFDMIELHYAHGYLLSSFISPLSNRRTDEYGGPLENRIRFPLEVLRAVRATWPTSKPICVRISAFDWIEGGTTIDDAIAMAGMLRDAGNDILSVSTGGITHERTRLLGRLYQATFSDQIRNEVGIPTMAVGGIAGHADANALIAAGRADVCALARGYLSDPYFVRRAARLQHHEMKWPSEYRGADQVVMRDD